MNAATSTVMSLLVRDEKTAQHTADMLAEVLDDDAAIAAFERASGWMVDVYFAQPPDEAALRATVSHLVGDAAAQALTFSVIEARDWVSASLAGLAPVLAGRFIVHGAHDRARVPANAIAVEIEAALAFGTGHHGTTRACLLALDTLLKARRPTHVLDIGTGTGVLAISAARARCGAVYWQVTSTRSRCASQARMHASIASDRSRVALSLPACRASSLKTVVRSTLCLPTFSCRPSSVSPSRWAALLAPGACVILSGLLLRHGAAALAAYRAHGLVLRRRIVLNEWVTLVLEKPRNRVGPRAVDSA